MAAAGSITSLKGGARRRVAPLRFAVAIIVALIALCAPLFVEGVDRRAPEVRQGRIDFTAHGPLTAPVELSGGWTLIWRSGPPGPAAGTRRLAQVPGRWSDAGALPPHGAVSYQLRLSGLKPGRYALYVPTLYTASRVIANGRTVSEEGVAGPSKATTRPTVRAHDVLIPVEGDTLDLQIDISSYYERDNGMEGAPVFGPAKAMSRFSTLHWLRGLLLLTACLLLAAYGLVIFSYRRQERGWLWFAVACLSVTPVLATFAHDNLILLMAPGMPLIVMRLIEYLSVLVALGAMLAYTRLLFPEESPRWPYRVLLAVIALDFVAYVAGAAVDGTMALSQVAWASLWVRIIVLLYVLGVVAVAAFRRRTSAAVYLLGMAVFFATLIITDLTTNGFLPPRAPRLDLMPLGMLVMLFSHIVIMAERWAMAIHEAEETAGELRGLLDISSAIASEIQLDTLLERIVLATSQILEADRGSLFLYDEREDELWSMVAEGVGAGVIRFPADQGLAGACFRSGAAMNVTDAYADPRFNPSVDQETGYRTQAVLSAPIVTRAGKRMGVMQAINRLDGQPFDAADVERITAFAAQAAVAIDNATLFGEVQSERNYNDAILGSLRSGVVTLDREASVVKLNAAACDILGVEPAEATEPGVQRAWAAANPWLSAELAAAGASGQPRSFLDADLVTVGGDKISANVSIVPLMIEGEQQGLVILLEDITEGKRLQGAMRRFMSQNVVDQIMGREDELLFGAACQASVLFADIRGFTNLSEALGPRDTVDMLNEIFTDLFEAVAGSGGVLDKYIGDAIMAVYGAPLSSGRDPQNAVDSAVAMVGMIAAINQRRAARGHPSIRLGVGIASGEVVAGTIGSPKRMDYTVIGDSVNLASRLEGVTKTYGVSILVCEDTARASDGLHPLRLLDAIKVRGRNRPARIFQVLTDTDAVPKTTLEAYAAGRRALEEGRWGDAVEAFDAAAAAAPHDGPSKLMAERARRLAAAPPQPGWDGVWDAAA